MPSSEVKKKSNLPTIIEKVDDELVESVLLEIKKLYHQKTHETVYAIGQCLCDHFYGGDLERIRKKKPIAGKSLTSLSRRCEDEVTGLSIAWLYASINLLVDRKNLLGCEEYEQLSISHKHALLQVKSVASKKTLVTEFTTKQLSVRQAIEQVKKYLIENPEARVTKKRKKSKTLGQLINQAHLLGEKKYKHLKGYAHLNKMSDEEIKKIREKAELRRSEVQSKIELFQENRKHLNAILAYCRDRDNNFEKPEHPQDREIRLWYEADLARKRKEIAEQLKAEGKPYIHEYLNPDIELD